MGYLKRSLSTETIKQEFKECFHAKEGEISKKLDFIRKYLKIYEEAFESMNNIFYNINPMLESSSFNPGPSEIDSECLNVLIKISKGKSDYEIYGKNFGDNDLEQTIATNKGLSFALLGMIYEFGAFSVSRSISKAVNFYITATRHSNTLGTYRLALCFEKGVGKAISIEKALVFYRCSAKLGGVEAMHAYGCILINGTFGVKKECGTGLLYLKMATKMASEHYPYPYYDLGTLFEDPGDMSEIWKDDEYAFSLYLKGANLGCSNCLFRIGMCYEFGELNRTINVKEMLTYYDKAASMFHVEAMYLMALQYTTGNTPYLERNIKLSYDLAVRAASRHHLNSVILVAEILEKDPMFKGDPTIVLWWYKVAESMGHNAASEKVKELLSQIKKMNTFTKSNGGCKLT